MSFWIALLLTTLTLTSPTSAVSVVWMSYFFGF